MKFEEIQKHFYNYIDFDKNRDMFISQKVPSFEINMNIYNHPLLKEKIKNINDALHFFVHSTPNVTLNIEILQIIYSPFLIGAGNISFDSLIEQKIKCAELLKIKEKFSEKIENLWFNKLLQYNDFSTKLLFNHIYLNIRDENLLPETNHQIESFNSCLNFVEKELNIVSKFKKKKLYLEYLENEKIEKEKINKIKNLDNNIYDE